MRMNLGDRLEEFRLIRTRALAAWGSRAHRLLRAHLLMPVQARPRLPRRCKRHQRQGGCAADRR